MVLQNDAMVAEGTFSVETFLSCIKICFDVNITISEPSYNYRAFLSLTLQPWCMVRILQAGLVNWYAMAAAFKECVVTGF